MSNGLGTLSPLSRRPLKAKVLRTALDAEAIQSQWRAQFESLEDPRGKQGVSHEFLSIVLIAILATIAGASGWEDIELYAESHQSWLGTFLNLKHGIPHADTYRRVFERIHPEQLQQCFLGWVEQVVAATGAQVIPSDGKTLKGSYDRNNKQSALHMAGSSGFCGVDALSPFSAPSM